MNGMNRLATVKQSLVHTFGWGRVMETRNKVRLAHTALAMRRFEDAEVARLAAALPHPPEALVAVVTATYRRPELLKRSVASVLAQTMRNLILVVVDDGGGLPELPDDPRLFPVSLSRNTNVLGVVLNIGIRLSRSQFVAFLDDDNEWVPHHLECALAGLQGDRETLVAKGSRRRAGLPDLVYTALDRRMPDGTAMDVISVPFDRRVLADGKPIVDTNALVSRRFRALRFSQLRRDRGVHPKEDWELVWRISRHHQVGHVPVPTVRYLVNPESYYTDWEGISKSAQQLRSPADS